MPEEIVVTDAQVKAAQMIVDHDKAAGRETDESVRKIAEARPVGRARTELAADFKKRYEAGESIRSIAASTGRSYGFVHRILTEQGVSLRGGTIRRRFGKR
jgi:Helix-turn-helix domain